MIHKLKSIQTIILKVVRDLGISDVEIPKDDMIEWIADGLKHVGSYYQFSEKNADITITDYKGELPCDFHKAIRILHGYCLPNNNESLIGDPGTDNIKFTNNDFNVNHNVITVGYRTGTIKLLYLALPLDDCGFPLVPDDVSFDDALFWKVAYHLSLRGHVFKNPKLNDLDFVSNKWGFYCRQARANANMPDLEMTERLKNQFLKLKTDQHQYSKLFSGLGKPENLNFNGKQ
jgi:hypothetical protein